MDHFSSAGRVGELRLHVALPSNSSEASVAQDEVPSPLGPPATEHLRVYWALSSDQRRSGDLADSVICIAKQPGLM